MTAPARAAAPRRVIHTGQALVDLVVEVPALPRRGGNVNARSATRYAGGSVTTLLAAARQGAEAVLAGSVGTGPYGDLVREVLTADGVKVSSPPVVGTDTAVCVVLVEPTAERTFVTTHAAERQISVASLSTSAPVGGDLVCVTGYSLYEPTVGPLVQWLEGLAGDVLVVLDPGAAFAGFDAVLRERVLARTHLWTSNAEEAAELTGVEPTGPDAAGAACAALAALLPEDAVVVVRDGPAGCHLRVAGTTTYVPGYPQTPVDTNGAGDTHTGVLCAGLAAGLDGVEACRRANAAGAIAVTRRGPTSAPTAAEVEDFLRRQGHAGAP